MPNVTPTTMFTNVLQLLGVLGASETTPAPEDTELLRQAFNRMMGQMNSRRRNCFFIQQQAFTFTTAKASYTIGNTNNTPAPDFALSGQDRPLRLEPWAQVVDTDVSPNVLFQMSVVNFDQYALISIPALVSGFPNTLYYQPTVPNGTLWGWPAYPTETSWKLQIAWRNQFTTIAPSGQAADTTQVAQGDVSTAINMPDGYEEAFTLTLAEKVWLAYPKRTDIEELKRQARLARADIQTNNALPTKIDTTDGVPNSKGSGFNWRSRTF